MIQLQSTVQSQPVWICCQLGAREHYAIPRALHQANQLAHLITDAWVPPTSSLRRIPAGTVLRTLYDRYHPDLAEAPVHRFTRSLLQFELAHRLKRTDTWEQIIARNRWFQDRAIQTLKILQDQPNRPEQPILFTYSYAALHLLRYAKSQGWHTILGQIDPGPIEEQIVIAEHQNHPTLAPAWKPVPPCYWETWREECRVADQILVNSTWSKQALQQAGIDTDKITIVPLSYQSPEATRGFQRTYPQEFSAQRPLRVLFLGQIILRKGVAAILEAAKLLQDKPIEFWMVGSIGIDRSQATSSNIRWVGAVPRSQVAQYYQQADVFLLPTLSDGFGLTQLEAQAWKLPLIVSRFCGEVVKDQVNGIILQEVSGSIIAQQLQVCLDRPQQLTHFAHNLDSPTGLDLKQLYTHLQHFQF